MDSVRFSSRFGLVLGCALVILCVIAGAYDPGHYDLFQRDNAVGATANAVKTIERDVDRGIGTVVFLLAVCACTLMGIFYRLGHIRYALEWANSNHREAGPGKDFRTKCPECGGEFTAPGILSLGSKRSCPKCNHKFDVHMNKVK